MSLIGIMISGEQNNIFLITTQFLAVLCIDCFYSGKKIITFESAFISQGAIKMSSSITKTCFQPNRHAQKWNGFSGRWGYGLNDIRYITTPTLGKTKNALCPA